MSTRIKFGISNDGYSGRINIWMRQHNHATGLRAVALPVQMEVAQSNQMPTSAEPMVSLPEEEGLAALQDLMEQLWHLGIRPKEVGTVGQLQATEAHLADFRAIVANTLKVKLP